MLKTVIVTLILSPPLPTLHVIRVPPLTLAIRSPEGAAIHCGYPANLSAARLGANPLILAGVPPNTLLFRRPDKLMPPEYLWVWETNGNHIGNMNLKIPTLDLKLV